MYGIQAVTICIMLFVDYVYGQVAGGQDFLNKLVCIDHEVCGACLSAAPHCRWCADPYFSNKVPRCNDDESLVAAGCSQETIQRPEVSTWEVEENHTLQDMTADNHDAVVQIQPQRVKLTLKPRETRKISFSYRPARNFPLDLYYLMDLTWSMKDDKETLVSLQDDLPKMLRNLTDNFRLGFGSFADKPMMPFISMDTKRKANPCLVEEEACEPTYAFRHHLTLTSQVSDFIKDVNNSKVTANLDNAEAQLDALVQVLACQDEIGWSAKSRKIVIVLSDGLMHTAGDGKLGVEQRGGVYSNPSFIRPCSLDSHNDKIRVDKILLSYLHNIESKQDNDNLSNRILSYECRDYQPRQEANTQLVAGAIRRNDEECHLDNNGYYVASETYDYPSVSQIYRLLDKHKVNVIFAVTENVKDHYDRLHKILEDFTYIARLESDSSNILKLVKTGYEDIVSVVNFEDNSENGPIKTKYFSDCGVPGGPMIETRRCSGVEFGMTLNYEVHITLDQCLEYKKSNETIRVMESQLGQDKLMIEVDLQCGCDCENGRVQRDMSAACYANSHLVCGVCQCDRGWSGPTCNCSTEDEATSLALTAQCRKPNATNTLVCSGAGDCLCGKCDCDRGFNGKYCQCKACEINRENGLECGGTDRGVCVCGQCACAAGWSGDACDCTEERTNCYAPGETDICSGHGECVCGKCQCSVSLLEPGVRYSGAFCETCATCENPLCVHAEPCVSCYLDKNCTDVCITDVGNYTVNMNLKDLPATSEDDTWCILRRYEDSMECEYRYTYNAARRSMIHMDIFIRNKECSQPTSARLMLSGVIIMACVIAMGLIVIICVKIAQVISDRRAYAKFAAEAQDSMLFMNERQQNPLYISPIIEFKLPDEFPRDKRD